MTKYEWEKELKRNIQSLPEDEIRTVLDYYNELFEDKSERGMSERDIIREFGNPFDVAVRILSEFSGEDMLNVKSSGNNINNNNGNGYIPSMGTGATTPNMTSNPPQKTLGAKIMGKLNDAGDALNKAFSDIARQFKRGNKAIEHDHYDGNNMYYPENNDDSDSFVITDGTIKSQKQKNKKGFSALKAVFLFPFIILIIVLGSVFFSLTISGAAASGAGFIYFLSIMLANLSGDIPNFIVYVGMSIACLGAGLILLFVGIKLSTWFLKGIKLYFFGRKEEKHND